MASITTPTVTTNSHTPICGQDCNLRHHDLVASMFHGRSCTSALIPHNGELPVALKMSIESAKLSGWDQNSDVPDPLEELRCPLLFLACGFGKTRIVKALLLNNFDPRVMNKYGETALHYMAQNLWSYHVEPCGPQETKQALESFERIIEALTDCEPKILAMKDDCDRTALHVLATNIMLCQNHNPVTHGLSFSSAPHFHQLCLKSIIKRLLKLLDATIFTKHEVIEIITNPESTYGDSVLHILARDSAYGFEVLQFLQNWLFAGKLPDVKNGEYKTVFEIAWETDQQSAEKMILNSPVKDFRQHPQCHQGSPYKETLISNDSEVSTTTADVAPEPQANHSEYFQVCTGYPCTQFTYPVFESEGDLPFITHVFSLSGNNSLISGKIYDPIIGLESMTVPSVFETVKCPAGVHSPACASPDLSLAQRPTVCQMFAPEWNNYAFATTKQNSWAWL